MPDRWAAPPMHRDVRNGPLSKRPRQIRRFVSVPLFLSLLVQPFQMLWMPLRFDPVFSPLVDRFDTKMVSLSADLSSYTVR